MADEAKTYTQAEVDAAIVEANKALEENRNRLLDQLKAQERKYQGVDLDEYRKMRETVAALETKANAEKAGLTSDELVKLRNDVRAEVERQYAADMQAGTKVFPWAASLAQENRALKLDNVVKTEMAKGGARAERIDALFRLTADRFDLTDDGKPMLRTSPGIEVGKYVADELRKEYPEFYNGSGSSGGGASKSTAGGGGSPNTIAVTDRAGFLANVEKIAKGQVLVSQ